MGLKEGSDVGGRRMNMEEMQEDNDERDECGLKQGGRETSTGYQAPVQNKHITYL